MRLRGTTVDFEIIILTFAVRFMQKYQNATRYYPVINSKSTVFHLVPCIFCTENGKAKSPLICESITRYEFGMNEDYLDFPEALSNMTKASSTSPISRSRISLKSLFLRLHGSLAMNAFVGSSGLRVSLSCLNRQLYSWTHCPVFFH